MGHLNQRDGLGDPTEVMRPEDLAGGVELRILGPGVVPEVLAQDDLAAGRRGRDARGLVGLCLTIDPVDLRGAAWPPRYDDNPGERSG